LNKLFLLILVSTFASGHSSLAHAESGISIPTRCFETSEYCTKSSIDRDDRNRQFINIKFYARVPNDYENKEELIDKLLAFQDWDDYTLGATEIQYRSSGLVSSRIYSGKRELTQYARYAIDAPWPAGQIEVVERTVYRELEPLKNLDAYWNFFTSREFSHQGIKRKDGLLKVLFIAPMNFYHIEVNMEVVPTTAFLKAARKAITNAIGRLFLGMFNLN